MHASASGFFCYVVGSSGGKQAWSVRGGGKRTQQAGKRKGSGFGRAAPRVDVVFGLRGARQQAVQAVRVWARSSTLSLPPGRRRSLLIRPGGSSQTFMRGRGGTSASAGKRGQAGSQRTKKKGGT